MTNNNADPDFSTGSESTEPLMEAAEVQTAPMQANLQLLFESSDAPFKAQCVDAKQIQQCCAQALSMQGKLDLTAVSDIELSIQFVSLDDMQSLNKQYRDKNVPTNVLSFASEMPPMMMSDDTSSGKLLVLGDLVFCQDVILSEAYEQHKRPENHWTHLFVHGTLHLCGYDHEQDLQADAMESLEIQILSALDIPDPYGISE